jgi:hypothetical protein
MLHMQRAVGPIPQVYGCGKAHYIEVTSDNEEDEDFGHIQNIEADNIETAEEEATGHDSATEEKATLASISGVPVQHLQDERSIARAKGFGAH